MKNKVIYWISTGLISLMMLFAGYSYFTAPQTAEGFRHLGFPDYFRVELAVAKILGAITLLVPPIPRRIKEWAYAGFGITFISAAIAHINSGDPTGMVIMPIIALGVLIISYVYLPKATVVVA
jgi:hypothetical protein